MTLKRAHCVLNIRSAETVGDERVIEGIATNASVDSYGDIVEPLGAQFDLPMPLLWQHEHEKPVGLVEFAKPTKEGVPFKARIFKVEEPGKFQEQCDLAWHTTKYGGTRGVSIGFRPLEGEVEQLESGGFRFKKWKWVELSLVTIPANSEATIDVIRSADREALAASGNKKRDGVVYLKAGASAQTNSQNQGNKTMLKKQLEAAEAKRAANAARMEALMKAAHEDGERTLDEAEAEEFDTLHAENETLDGQIRRLKVAMKSAQDEARPVDGETVERAAQSRGPAIVTSTKNDEPGLTFARFAMSLYAAKGSAEVARSFAENRFGKDLRLNSIMKAAVAAGTTSDPTWAGNLVDYQSAAGEFLEFLRPRTIVGQFGQNGVPALRRVPFNVRIPGKTSAGTAGWVGEGYRKPVTSSGYDAATLDFAKIAAISVITEELERFSDPSVQLLVRDDLAEAVIARMDEDFVDPAKAAGTGAYKSPASITNGIAPTASTGDVDADLAALWATADGTNMPTSSAVYLTDSATARQLTRIRNPLSGQRLYPDVNMNGGSIDGTPVIVSNYVPAGTFILAFASEIYLADDGVVTIDVSRDATIVMDDDPNGVTDVADLLARMQNMFQENKLAIRAERYVTWQRRRPQAVAYLTDVNWAPVVDGGDGGDGGGD